MRRDNGGEGRARRSDPSPRVAHQMKWNNHGGRKGLDDNLRIQQRQQTMHGSADLKPIDRTKVPPFLLRVFPRVGAHHSLEEFARRGQEPKGEINVYTWVDADLKEICELVKDAYEPARRPSARFSVSLVYPDRTGCNVLRHVGAVNSQRPGPDDAMTLRSVNFEIGDYLSLSIY